MMPREFKRALRFLKAWTLPRIMIGENHWMGRFVVVHAPLMVSLSRGRGTHGLYLLRFSEKHWFH